MPYTVDNIATASPEELAAMQKEIRSRVIMNIMIFAGVKIALYLGIAILSRKAREYDAKVNPR